MFVYAFSHLTNWHFSLVGFAGGVAEPPSATYCDFRIVPSTSMNCTVCVPSGCPPAVSMAAIRSGKSCGLISEAELVFSLIATATSLRRSVRLLFLAIILNLRVYGGHYRPVYHLCDLCRLCVLSEVGGHRGHVRLAGYDLRVHGHRVVIRY